MAPYPENPGPLDPTTLAGAPLKKGDSGDEVRKLQRMLEFLEYSCGPKGPDGIFGDYTKKAVQKFQGEHKDYDGEGLSRDGTVGKHTSDALNRCMVGKWYGKWLTPVEFTKKFRLLTITEEDLKEGGELEIPKGIEKIRVVVAPVYKEMILGICLTPISRDWLPDARNHRITFTARIRAKKDEDWIETKRKRRIIFRLNSSKEKGICMNFPRKANTNPDLFFADDVNRSFKMEDDKTDGPACPTTILTTGDNPTHRHHYQKMTTLDMVTEAVAVVRCEDFGAFGFLEAFIDDGKELPPCADADPVSWDENTVCEKKVKVKIPWDENGNDIADCADQDAGGHQGDSDDDDTPGGDGKGDGLTNYEEYRGFMVKEGKKVKHIRTDITKKDVFVLDRDNQGLGYFAATNLAIHLIPGPDYYNGDSANHDDQGPDPNTQVINFNRGHLSRGVQHGIRLVDESIMLYLSAGVARGTGPGPPKTCNRAAINRKYCLSVSQERFARTVAHELGHAINMQHHGPNQPHACDGGLFLDSDLQGSVTSGDVTCIMRYVKYKKRWCHDVAETRRIIREAADALGIGEQASQEDIKHLYTNRLKELNAILDSRERGGIGLSNEEIIEKHIAYENSRNVLLDYCKKLSEDEHHQFSFRNADISIHCYHTHKQVDDPIGTTYCSSAEATGLNVAGGHKNNATLGNCRGQLKVKDW